MKLSRQLLLKKGNAVVAIIGMDGKVLSNDKKTKATVEYLMKERMVAPEDTKTKLVSISNEGQLIAHLMESLEPFGIKLEQ